MNEEMLSNFLIKQIANVISVHYHRLLVMYIFSLTYRCNLGVLPLV